ncbi:MAG: M1 family aminopeptidase [Candidatus Xenobia bacterium]
MPVPFATDDTPQRYIPDTTFRTRHIRLEVTVDMEGRSLFGWCHTTVEKLGAGPLELDAVDMQIAEVKIGRKVVPHEYDGARLRVPVAQDTTVSIRYATHEPPAGIRFVGDQAYTQGQSDDTRFWVPCRDVPAERATFEMVVTVPEDYVATSNGALIEERHDRRRQQRTFHWRTEKPLALYLMTLTVGRFAQVETKWRGVPVTYLCERGREADAERGFGRTPKMMEFFSERLGVPYPWEKYAQVAVNDYFGGMENTSATTQTFLSLLDEQVALDHDMDGLVAHELAHQWFGDLVTCYDWTHAWLNESFATYLELLFHQADKGHDEFLHRLYRYAQTYFDEQKNSYTRPTVTRQWRESFHLFDRHLYQRGACFLRFLHHQLGDGAWWRSLKLYLERHRDRAVQTTDLIEAFREVSGRNPERWFDEWIFRAGHPDLFVSCTVHGRRVELWVVQRDGKTKFTLPLEIRFASSRGRFEEFHETISEREHGFTYRLDFEPAMLLIDPELIVAVKKLEVVKPRKMWKTELRQHPSPVGRIEAAHEVAKWGTPEAARELESAFWKESFWAVAKMGAGLVEKPLEAMLHVPHPKARRMAVDAFAGLKSPRAMEALTPLENDVSIFVQSAVLQAMAKSGSSQALPVLMRGLERDSWNETIRVGAVEGLRALGATDALRDCLRPVRAVQVRAAALRGLADLLRGDPEILTLLRDALNDDSLAMQNTAVHQLGRCGLMGAADLLRDLLKQTINSALRAQADRALRELRLGI